MRAAARSMLAGLAPAAGAVAAGVLAANYPADRATGFREGELRGWFWIEVPPEKGR